MLPTITIGPLVLPTAGLVYIIGAWVALSMVEHSAKALELDAEAVYGLSAVALAAGFIGARLLFVALHWPAYRDNLGGIVWPLTSGFDVWGGLFFAIAAAFFYGRAKQLPPAATLDALAPGLFVALISGSLADFLAGPGYGTETAVPWSLDVYGIRRHPVQLYEVIVALLALLVWWRALDHRSFDGQLFLISVGVYSAGRLIFDAYRANAWLTSSGYHVLQIASLVILLVCIFLLGRRLTAKSSDVEAA
jgi:phosphatidylglycerol:prolipoprotein diacylglycerol transferase